MSRLLLSYRILANVVGVLLIVLVFVAVPLRYAGGQPLLSKIVSPMHGYFYLVYVVVAFLLCRRANVPAKRTALVLSAGLLPFLTFVVERRLTRDLSRFVSAGAPEVAVGG